NISDRVVNLSTEAVKVLLHLALAVMFSAEAFISPRVAYLQNMSGSFFKFSNYLEMLYGSHFNLESMTTWYLYWFTLCNARQSQETLFVLLQEWSTNLMCTGGCPRCAMRSAYIELNIHG
ncbi:hypothetical protein J6590_033093, partial [Homalodisca vitripennis]